MIQPQTHLPGTHQYRGIGPSLRRAGQTGISHKKAVVHTRLVGLQKNCLSAERIGTSYAAKRGQKQAPGVPRCAPRANAKYVLGVPVNKQHAK